MLSTALQQKTEGELDYDNDMKYDTPANEKAAFNIRYLDVW